MKFYRGIITSKIINRKRRENTASRFILNDMRFVQDQPTPFISLSSKTRKKAREAIKMLRNGERFLFSKVSQNK